MAVRYHQGGNLAEAESIYRQVLQAEPRNVNALHFLGILANQAGRHDLGIPLIRQAIAINPSVPDFHANLSLALFEQGNVFFGQRQIAQAAECYRQALTGNPHFVDAHNNLGNALKDLGRLAEAAACFRQALALDPRYANAHFNLGNVLFDQGQFSGAAESYRQALGLNPNDPNAHNNLGNALKEQGLLAEATECYRQALRLTTNQADFHVNLGNVLKDQGELIEAAESYRQALQLNPNLADAHSSLGITLVGQRRLAEAAESFQQALRLNPKHWFAALEPLAPAACYKGISRAWQDYGMRWARPEMLPRSFPQPRWDGTPLAGKTILVYAEQGLGDTLQFARYLPMVKQRGGNVIFDCQPALQGLFAGMNGINHLVREGEPIPPFDVQVPLLSLPGIFQTTPTTIPAQVPYLEADPDLVLKWEAEIRRAARRKAAGEVAALTIGIVWQGNSKMLGDRLRSIPLKFFEPLARVPGVRLVSLQKGSGADQLRALQVIFPILDLGDGLNTFSDTAAVMKNLDLIVTSDTSVAHLAGALGVPVWTVLQFVPDWRWFLDRPDSQVSDHAALFRQKNSAPGPRYSNASPGRFPCLAPVRRTGVAATCRKPNPITAKS